MVLRIQVKVFSFVVLLNDVRFWGEMSIQVWTREEICMEDTDSIKASLFFLKLISIAVPFEMTFGDSRVEFLESALLSAALQAS